MMYRTTSLAAGWCERVGTHQGAGVAASPSPWIPSRSSCPTSPSAAAPMGSCRSDWRCTRPRGRCTPSAIHLAASVTASVPAPALASGDGTSGTSATGGTSGKYTDGTTSGATSTTTSGSTNSGGSSTNTGGGSNTNKNSGDSGSKGRSSPRAAPPHVLSCACVRTSMRVRLDQISSENLGLFVAKRARSSGTCGGGAICVPQIMEKLSRMADEHELNCCVLSWLST